MLCTAIYYGGVRSFASTGVQVKSSEFQNDQDGGIQSVLLDIAAVNNHGLGQHAVKVNT